MTAPAYDLTTEGLAAALAAFGDTETAVAAALAQRGCRGVMDSPGNCPVAVYLRSFFLQEVSVDDNEAAIYPGDLAPSVNAAVPGQVADFIAAFDRGNYPDLIEAGPEEFPLPAGATSDSPADGG